LHDNGVLRGLGFDFINPTDNREIFYKGGVALVNGTIVTVNAISVTIPEIHDAGDSPPPPSVTVDWAVCVNEGGNLEPIVITSTKTQFFVKDNNSASTYYVPSVTFAELVDTRKDLTPIAVVTATIASTTITDNDHLDVRRFVDDGKGRELVYSPVDFAGTFHTPAAVVNWANKIASANPLKIKVRGIFNVATSLDFTGLTSPIELEGDGAVFNVTANRGLLVDSLISIKGITFNYNPSATLVFTTSDKINGTNGCIYNSGAVSDVTIEDCVFNSSENGQRPPFISFEIDDAIIVNGLRIRRNQFNDSGTGDAALQSAVAIVNVNDAGGIQPAILYSVRIEENTCDKNQGIYILPEALSQVSSSLSISGPGMRAFDVTIARNNCGAIGWLTTSTDSTATLATTGDRPSGITIENNTCNIIAHMFNHNFATATSPGTRAATAVNLTTLHSLGRADIVANNCNLINVLCNEVTANDTFCRMLIDRNKIATTLGSFIDNWGESAQLSDGTNQLNALAVFAGLDSPGEAIISNNIITPGLFDATTHGFFTGITTAVSANVTGNIIRGMIAAGNGIVAFGTGTAARTYNVSNNQIFRASAVTITRFINLDTSATRVPEGSVCAGNIFNSRFIDSGSTDDETINGTGTGTPATPFAFGWVVERNINQTETMSLVDVGWVTVGGGVAVRNGTSTTESIGIVSSVYTDDLAVLGQEAVQLFFDLTDSSSSIQWIVLLNSIVPIGAKIIDAEIDMSQTTISGTADSGFLRLSRNGVSLAQDSEVVPQSPSTITLKLTDDAGYTTPAVTNPANRIRLEASIVMAGSSNSTVTMSAIRLTFRW